MYLTVQEINRCSRFSCTRSFVNWYCLLSSIHPESPYACCYMFKVKTNYVKPREITVPVCNFFYFLV